MLLDLDEQIALKHSLLLTRHVDHNSSYTSKSEDSEDVKRD